MSRSDESSPDGRGWPCRMGARAGSLKPASRRSSLVARMRIVERQDTVSGAEIRALFPGLRDTIYLNTATMAVGCAPAREAYERAVEHWAAGRFDWMEAEQAGEDT